MSGQQFDPNSTDAVLARILAGQEAQMQLLREHRDETRAGFEKFGKRIGEVERWRDTLKGKLAVASAGVSLAVATGTEWLKVHIGGGNGK